MKTKKKKKNVLTETKKIKTSEERLGVFYHNTTKILCNLVTM